MLIKYCVPLFMYMKHEILTVTLLCISLLSSAGAVNGAEEEPVSIGSVKYTVTIPSTTSKRVHVNMRTFRADRGKDSAYSAMSLYQGVVDIKNLRVSAKGDFNRSSSLQECLSLNPLSKVISTLPIIQYLFLTFLELDIIFKYHCSGCINNRFWHILRFFVVFIQQVFQLQEVVQRAC